MREFDHGDVFAFMPDGGDIGRLMRSRDWSGSPLGPPSAWSQPLRTVVGLLLGSQFPMFVAWGDELGFLYNDAYAEILGAKHPAALGGRFENIWGEIWPDISPLIDAAMSGRATYSENLPLVVNRAGFDEQAWFTFSYSPVRNEGGIVAGMFCVVAETTGRVLAEQAVRAERDRAQGVLDNMAEAFVLLDRNFRIVDMNDEAMRLENRPKDAILGRTHWEAHPGASPQLGNLYRKAMRERRTASLQHHYVWPDGRDTWIEMRAYPVGDGLAVFYRDVTERVMAERLVAESEARFRGVFDSRLTGLSVFDANTGETLAINDTFLAMTGHTRADFDEGRWDWRNFTVPEYLHLDEEAIAQACARGFWETYEKKYRRLDGTCFPVRIASAALPGEPGRVVVSAEDITKERAANEALSASEAVARTRADELAGIYDAAPVGLCVLDCELRYRRVNDRLAEINGVPAADHIGRAVRDVVPDLSDQVVATMRRVLEGEEVWNTELSGTTQAQPGVVRTWRENWLPLRDGAGTIVGVTISAEEITEAKRVQAALQESESRFRGMADGAPVMMWVTDPTGYCTYLNAPWYEFTGQQPGAGEGYGWLDAVHLEDRPAAEAAFVDANAEHKRYRIDFRLRRADGVYRWVIDAAAPRFSGDGAYLGYVGSVIDIEDRKELEAALERRVAERTSELSESKQRFQGIFDSALQFMALLRPDGTVVEVNQTALDWSEVDASEIVGKPFWLAAPMRDNPELQEAVRTGIGRAAAGETVRAEHEMRGAGEVRATVDFSLKPVLSEAGEVAFLVAEGRDITALKEAQEALRQSQKMEAMGQLTGGVAHDFNNLLTPIVGALDMLQRKGVGGEREQRLIGGAAQSAERARTLVQRLLAFARRQPLQPSSVDVGELTRGMAELVGSTTGPQIKVVVEAPQHLPPATADANQLEMAVLNLAVNARDAMPDGGTLRISVEAATVGRQHRSKLKPGRYLQLSVADTGTGMDEATLARAIEPFFSTKGVGKGTGLGLSMVHGLASQLGGAMTISSSPGMGTNVELWLPQSSEAAHPVIEPGAPPSVSAGRGTVLLVDDEDLVRLSTADMLTELCYTVVEASSAEEALRLLDRGLNPDIVVTDHLMPGMSGTDLVRLLRKDRPGIMFLVVSGYAETFGLTPDLPRLTKPFRSAELAAAIAALG
jgi:PAS domain S-box-containing protein